VNAIVHCSLAQQLPGIDHGQDLLLAQERNRHIDRRLLRDAALQVEHQRRVIGDRDRPIAAQPYRRESENHDH